MSGASQEGGVFAWIKQLFVAPTRDSTPGLKRMDLRMMPVQLAAQKAEPVETPTEEAVLRF
jgi:hypothetical protein